jgi:hypothetical protein
MKPSTLQKIIIENYNTFYSIKRRSVEDPLKGTAFGRGLFKLFMVNPEMRVAEKYIPFLQELEAGLYDGNEHLIESRLPKYDVPVRHIPLDLSDN